MAQTGRIGERQFYLLPCRRREREGRRNRRRGEEECLRLGPLKVEVGNRLLHTEGDPSGDHSQEEADGETERQFLSY